MKKRNKVVITLILVIVFILAAVYVAGWIFFETRYLPGTMINGKDFSFGTPEEVESVLTREVQTWALAVDTMYNGREGITGKEIDMVYQTDGSAQRFLEEQNRALWFLHVAGTKDLRIKNTHTFSEEKLIEAIDQLKCMQNENVEKPEDAYIRIEGDQFTIIPEVEGNMIDRDKVIKVLTNAAEERLLEVNLEDEGCYVKPAVSEDSESITTSILNLENCRDAYITLDFGDRTETVDWELIKDWIMQDADGFYVLDPEKVGGYVRKLAETYNTVGIDREFLTYDDRRITVQGGDYGWVIDEEKETAELMNDILSGLIDVKEPIYSQTAASRSRVSDLALTYIEIDLANQKLVYYEEGKPVIETEIISGYPHEAASQTPTGTYIVTAKRSPGTIVDTGVTQNVYYLLEFAGGLAISDASWRLEFGGDVYYWEGTDGGIEVPLDDMDRLYQIASEGTAVVIYN